MDFSRNAADQVAREPAWTPGWSGRLLMFSFTVFLLSVGVFVGIKFGYRPYLESEIKKIEASIGDFLAQYPRASLDSIRRVASQFGNVGKVLDAYGSPRGVFEWLESTTLPSVSYSKMEFRVKERELTLTAQVRDDDDIARQLELFRRDTTMVERVLFKSASTGARGGLQFAAVLTLKAPGQTK